MTTKSTTSKSSGRLVAGIDANGDRVSVVVARTTSGGAGGTGTVSSAVQVVEARSFAAADKAGIAAMCERLRVSLIVRVVPADSCTARATTVPTGDLASMLSAASLLAESEVPADVPPHRRAGGILPARPGAGTRDALLTAWLRTDEQPARLSDKVDETWTTPAACLAALKGTASVGVLQRPDQSATCILATGESSAFARVVIEDASDAQAWSDAISSALADACTAASVAVPTEPLNAPLGLSTGMDELRSRALGVRIDESWLREHAAALGAAMAGLDCPPGLAPLASLHALPPKERIPAPVRFATWISRAWIAWPVAIAASLLLVAGPWALAHQREAIATSKANQLTDAKSQTKDLGLKAATYEQLEAARWPMTKILADIAGAAPVGVTIEDARVSTEQGVTLRGVAKSRELVNELEKNLGSTKVFRNIKQNRNESKAEGGAEFDLSAQIDLAQVHLPVKPLKDFAAKSLAEELHGPGATNTTIPVGAKRQAPAGSRSSSSRTSSSDTVDTSRRTINTPSAEPPPALTDAEIAGMDRNTAMRGFSQRRNFLSTKGAGLDPSVKSRLEGEVDKLKERMQKAGEGGDKK